MGLALFGLDGTLVQRGRLVRAALSALSRDHGYGPDIEQWLLAELSDRAEPKDFDRLRAAFPIKEDAEYLWRVFLARTAASVRRSPAVLHALVRLKAAGWSAGIVTNGPSDLQRAKVQAAGLADLVDGIAVSGDIDVHAPDPRLFELAAARCGTRLGPGDWMIGVDLETDLIGGHKAGLQTIWVGGEASLDDVPLPHHAAPDVAQAVDHVLSRPGA
ncbi:HAD family hydrolase [Streptomyces cynarae]|uniref:HAD family hydrolase n=1 Tax=Streptomyces cynarae TaxID=2981134 RepID=UPI00406C92A2